MSVFGREERRWRECERRGKSPTRPHRFGSLRERGEDKFGYIFF